MSAPGFSIEELGQMLRAALMADTRNPRIHRVNLARVHRALHVLWTKHASLPGYEKALWGELDNAIDVLATDGPGPLKGGAAAG